jgi:predicted phosphodiesterase
MKQRQIRPRISGKLLSAYYNLIKEERRILVIGDLHEPFTHPDYLDFCLTQYENFNCNQVIFIGDILDSHGWSYHEPDVNFMSAGDELNLAIKKVAKWYQAFPNADICIGNHDRLASRKMMTAGVPQKWIRGYNDVLNTPKWNWVESVEYDNVLYEHGEGSKAFMKARNNMLSSVCGHHHTDAGVMWYVGKKFRVFGMQVGCGIDIKSYAAAYAKNFKRQALGCGIVLGGHTAINRLMDL